MGTQKSLLSRLSNHSFRELSTQKTVIPFNGGQRELKLYFKLKILLAFPFLMQPQEGRIKR